VPLNPGLQQLFDLVELLGVLKMQAVVITRLSRNVSEAKKFSRATIGE
jgi:hypothetical protein